MFSTILTTFVHRFKEPSSWSVVFTTLTAVGVSVPDTIAQPIALALAGVAGLLGFFLSEKKVPQA